MLANPIPVSIAASLCLAIPLIPAKADTLATDTPTLEAAAKTAEQMLQQSFSNLRFEDFAPSPVKGPVYQAMAGGKILYFAPESEHLLFAAVYDKDGVNVTALAESSSFQKRLARLDLSQALVIGPANAPTVIEFTDPDCPYCRALERFWATKQAEGKAVRRVIIFVTGIHPTAAAKAEHILCSPDPVASFHALYAGENPSSLRRCAEGRARLERSGKIVADIGISGTPTLVIDKRLITGFQQSELEKLLETKRVADSTGP